MGRSGLAGAVLLALAAAAVAREDDAPAAPEPPPVRRIAPDLIPSYRTDPGRGPAPPVVAPPTDEQPLGACEREARNFSNCLRLTAELVDRMLDALVAEALAAPPADRGAAARRPLLARALEESQRRFRALRDFECQQLIHFEEHGEKSAYDARMICMIQRSMARLRDLRARFLPPG